MVNIVRRWSWRVSCAGRSVSEEGGPGAKWRGTSLPLSILLIVAAACGDDAVTEGDAGIESGDAALSDGGSDGPSYGDGAVRDGSMEGPAALLGLRVPGDRSDVLEATFSRALLDVSNDDFFTNDTHALVRARKMTGPLQAGDAVEEVANPDGSFTYRIPLSDHVVPGETPELVYFQERGDITDLAGNRLPSILFAPVDISEVTTYDGERTLRTVDRSGAWNDVVAALADNTIVRIERGFDSAAAPLVVQHENLTLTAYGTGDAPRITFSGDRFHAISATDTDHVSFVGLHIVSDGMNGIAYRDRSSHGAVIGCSFDRVDTRSDAQAAIDFFFQSSSPTGYTRPEGPKALFNEIRGHNGGIFFNLSEVARYEWRQRYVADTNGDGYRQPAMIIGNYIKLRNHGSDKGDAIAVSRADHNWAEVSFNLIEGWVDDGFDAFQGQRIIVEFNIWDQQLDEARPSGGSAIKAGGDGRADDDPMGSFTSGFGGELIIRYNLIENTSTGSATNQHGINTNNGGDVRGMSNTIEGERIVYGKTLIYGNVVYGVRDNAMQMIGADGGDFEIYNNLFISQGGLGVRFSRGTNVDDLVFRNNIVSSALTFDGIPDSHNIWLEGSVADGTYEPASESLHPLSAIFRDVEAIGSSPILPESPTIDAGDATGLVYARDSRGQPVRAPVDIGPIEAR